MKQLIGTWRQKIRDAGLGTKMVLVYVLVFGVVAATTLAALQVTLNIYDGQIYEKSLQELNYFTKSVDRELERIEQLSYDLATDYSIQSQLSDAMELDNQIDYSFQMSKLRSRLTAEIVSEQALSEVIYTDKQLIRYEVGNRYVPLPAELYQTMLSRFEEAKGAYVSQGPTDEFPYLVSGRDIRKHLDASLNYLGSLIFVADISEMIHRQRQGMETETASLCVYSAGGLIYESEPGLYQAVTEQLDNRSYQIIKQSGEKYFVCQLQSVKTGWVYVNRFPYGEIYSLNTIVRNSLVAGLVLLFIAASLAVRRLAGIITSPLIDLTGSMEIVEAGDFQKAKAFLKDIDRKDEVGILTQEFKVMLDRITLLIHENYEKQLLIKDTQYQALQAQINPHFLYNTLNSINWMIRRGRNDEASNMLISLSELLRAALRKEPDSTVGDELELLHSYIAIQQIRYQRRAVFTIEADEGLAQYRIPHMVLQPLVENSINYGVDNSLRSCEIRVGIRQEGDRIHLYVEDGGPGMSTEELAAVRNFTIKPKGNGIGLKNIADRLDHFFAGEAVFEIGSRPGQGTAVHIRIPMQARGAEHV